MSIRKILIPVVAGLLFGPASMAATVDEVDTDGPSTTFFYSDEFLQTAVAASMVSGGDLAVTLGAEYAVGDVASWIVSGSAVDAGFPNSVIFDCVAESGAGVGDGLAGLTFGLLSSDADGASYRVTTLDTATCAGATSTVGAVIEYATVADGGAVPPLLGSPGLRLDLDAQAVAAAGTINAAYSAQTSTGLALDTAGGASRNVDLVITGSQFDLDVTDDLDGIVDVNQLREGLVTDEAGASCIGAGVCDDVLDWTVDPVDSPAAADFTMFAGTAGDDTDIDLTVNASFGWVVDTDDTTEGIQFPGTTFGTTCSALALEAAELTADCTNGAESITIDVFANVDAAGDLAVLPATSYVGTFVFTFTGIGGVEATTSLTVIDLGDWTLNGFQTELSYMPFQGSSIGQVIYLANRGTQSGLITVDWIDQNGNSGTFDVGTIAAGSTKSIGPLIQAGLPAAQQDGGRIALTITANVPACDGQVNAQYNVGGNRAFTSQRDNCN